MRILSLVLAATLAVACSDAPPEDVAVDLPGGLGLVDLALEEGQNATNRTVTLTNNGPADMIVTITNFEATGGDWLATTPSTLTITHQTSATFDLVFTTAALPPGLYTATVRLDAVSTPGGKRALGSPYMFKVNLVVKRAVAVLDTATDGVSVDVPAPVGWTEIASYGAPTARVDHTLTWVGGELAVVGGYDEYAYGPAADGGAFYDPDAAAWRPMVDASGGDARAQHGTVWDRANDRLVIYGGTFEAATPEATTFVNDVMTYDLDPEVEAPWNVAYATSGLDPRAGHVMVDAGTQWLAWGGHTPKAGGGIEVTNTGWRCDYGTTSCVAMSTSDAPAPRHGALGVWTGQELLVFGGLDLANNPLWDGGRYDPVADTWTAMRVAPGPQADPGRYGGCWTGRELVVFGGRTATARSNELWVYDPLANAWRRPLPPTAPNTPSARQGHTVVWTGSRVVVFGGYDGASALASGGAYDVDDAAWYPLPYDDTPEQRWMHTAVWTGTRMLVWGGATPTFTASGSVLE